MVCNGVRFLSLNLLLPTGSIGMVFVLVHLVSLYLWGSLFTFYRYVLYKEKNMLLTEANIHRRGQMYLPQPDRLQKVKKSMGAIKAVLGERKRDAIAQTALKQAMMEEQLKGSEPGELEK